MKLYSKNKDYTLYQGNMLELNSAIDNNSIDAIITDPPYELNFMNKGWDNSGIAFQKETWEKCYQVLKPGGYLLAFGGSRTFHRIACAIEDAGFEIRDTIMWLYGSGFPKSMNIGLTIDKKNGVESKIIGYQGSMMDFRDTGKKQKEISGIDKLSFGQIENSERKENPIYEAQNEWQGWGTALKPSFEPIIVARKPFKGSLVDNVIEYGVGGLNIDECRIPLEDSYKHKETNHHARTTNVFTNDECGFDSTANHTASASPLGRFPANTILTYDEVDFDEVCGALPKNDRPNGSITKKYKINNQVYGEYGYCNEWEAYQDSDSAARYFYCAKASKKDRDEGCDFLEDGTLHRVNGGHGLEDCPKFAPIARKNTHPTVKPTELMQYLVRLVAPNGATILDPFMGSGSTGKAVMYENAERKKDYKFVGIELTEEYLPIAKARIDYACGNIENIAKTPTIKNSTEKANLTELGEYRRISWDIW